MLKKTKALRYKSYADFSYSIFRENELFRNVDYKQNLTL